MDLLSVFRRKPPAAEPAAAADAVQLARTRARQRLIGAAVLVVAGIIGFPLVFETQPRPVPVDLPIEIPRKDKVPPLAAPGTAPTLPTTPPAAAASPAIARPMPAEAAPAERVITETQAEAGREMASSPLASKASAPTPAAPAAASAATKAQAASAVAAKAIAPAPRASASATESAPAADGARAQALLDGSASAPSPAASGPPRFVVQVGAFTDPAALKDTRAKVEKLGLKTYTQVAETPGGPRTRVRVGPFATRDEADRAAARLKAASLPAIILAL